MKASTSRVVRFEDRVHLPGELRVADVHDHQRIALAQQERLSIESGATARCIEA